MAAISTLKEFQHVFRISVCLASLGVFMLASALPDARAREPGIAPVTPPGLTLGIPIAVGLPDGLYLTQRSSYYDATLYNPAGQKNGETASVFANSTQITYVPGLTILGGTYKAFILVPLVEESINRTTPATGRPGKYSQLDFANPKIQPIDLCWNLGNGFNVGTGVGVYVPVGQYTPGAPVNIGADFYTVEPSVGFTYLKDGWNASLQTVYDTNTRNNKLKYLSGDQIMFNATVTKDIGGFNVGPVSYFQRQITGDANDGGRATFGGKTFSAPSNLAFGGLVSHRLGSATVTAYVTDDVAWYNTIGGVKGWLGVTFKLL